MFVAQNVNVTSRGIRNNDRCHTESALEYRFFIVILVLSAPIITSSIVLLFDGNWFIQRCEYPSK